MPQISAKPILSDIKPDPTVTAPVSEIKSSVMATFAQYDSGSDSEKEAEEAP